MSETKEDGVGDDDSPLSDELAREAAEERDVVPELRPPEDVKTREPSSPRTPRERKSRDRSNSRSREKSKSLSKGSNSKSNSTPKGVTRSPSFKLGGSPGGFQILEEEEKPVEDDKDDKDDKDDNKDDQKDNLQEDKLTEQAKLDVVVKGGVSEEKEHLQVPIEMVPEKKSPKTAHRRGFSTLGDEPVPSFHPPTPVSGGREEKGQLRDNTTRHVRSGSATVIQRAFRTHATRRQRAFTNTNMEEKEALQFSQSFQVIQDIRSRALKWEDLKDMKQLTRGMFGEVHTAVFRGYPVIVKTLKPMKAPKDPQTKNAKKLQEEEQLAISDFKKEMSMLTKLWHRKIVHLIGVGVKPKLFMVMEFMEGGSLKDVLAESRRTKIPMDRSVVFDYAMDCAHGMRYLHEAFPRILHRDLKPANLLISKPPPPPAPPDKKPKKKKRKGVSEPGTPEHERPELKIADFGLSRVLGPTKKQATERYRLTGGTGSLRYMAPEVAANQPYNEKADVYGFGIILWEMLANDLPYKKLHTHNFYKEVVKKKIRPPTDPTWPQLVAKLIEDCWAHDPDARPTFRTIIQQLQQIKDTTDFFNGEQEKEPAGCCTII